MLTLLLSFALSLDVHAARTHVYEDLARVVDGLAGHPDLDEVVERAAAAAQALKAADEAPADPLTHLFWFAKQGEDGFGGHMLSMYLAKHLSKRSQAEQLALVRVARSLLSTVWGGAGIENGGLLVLLECLKTSVHAEVRLAAAHELARVVLVQGGSARSLDSSRRNTLVQAFHRETDPAVRAAIVPLVRAYYPRFTGEPPRGLLQTLFYHCSQFLARRS